MKEKGIKSMLMKAKDAVVNMIMEEQVEIVDNGLDNASPELEGTTVKYEEKVEAPKVENIEEVIHKNHEESHSQTVSRVKEAKEDIKNIAKSTFSKNKNKTLEEELFAEEKEEEKEKSTMDLIKGSALPPLEIIETNPVENKSSFKYEKATIEEENVTTELTEAQKEERKFFDMLTRKEKVLDEIRKSPVFANIDAKVFGKGFEDTYFSLMEGIEDNMVLEAEDKNKIMNKILSDLYKCNDTEEDVYDCFNLMRHELHKVKHGLGIYGNKVYSTRDIQTDSVKDYKIGEMFENPATREFLLKEDMDNFMELMSLTETMMHEIDNNKLLNTMPEKSQAFKNEFVDMLWMSDNYCDVLSGIETMKVYIHQIKNNLGRFNGVALLNL